VIVDPAGYIITNEHVVRNARQIRVMLTLKPDDSADSLAPPAKQPALDPAIMNSNRDPVGKRKLRDSVVLGTSREADLALLKIETSNLPAIPLQAKERGPRQGQVVLAVGSPEGTRSRFTLNWIRRTIPE
jgi:S1-C subfamily serine protease